MDKQKDYFGMIFYYNTLHVEELTESLVFDTDSFLATAGGNLGLFLGFSCMSVLFALVKVIKRFYLKKKCVGHWA